MFLLKILWKGERIKFIVYLSGKRLVFCMRGYRECNKKCNYKLLCKNVVFNYSFLMKVKGEK